MPRESIAMSAAELADLLGTTPWVVLGTLGPDGGPQGSLAASALTGERLCFAVRRGSTAHTNIERDPRVCCSTDEYPTYYAIRGATAHGTAQPSEPPASLRTPELVTFSIALDDVVSFDFSKIERRV